MSKYSEPQSLEFYIAQIAHELRDLPSQARADELREIEAHLRAMLEARGDSPIAETLAQFGKPRRVGRDLRRAWERKQPEAWWRVIVAPFVGFALQMILSLLLTNLFLLGSYFSLNTKIESVFPASVTAIISIFLFLLSYVALALVTGFGIGAVSPKRGRWVIAVYFLSTMAMLLSELSKQDTSNFHNSGDFLFSYWFIGGGFLLSCLPYLYGNHLGAHHTRRLLFRVANVK